ncbi:MAG: hypothetical protein EPO24_15315 [Bacteroidetes bacterium]|nr:MAG: hypothetical protein EPO24_15315 [Bacteroidota bacterium]
MKMKKWYSIGKLLEAIGIAAVMLGLVQGIYGDMWGELYLLLAGIAVFYAGRIIEKKNVS